jgi:hypothetical protein
MMISRQLIKKSHVNESGRRCHPDRLDSGYYPTREFSSARSGHIESLPPFVMAGLVPAIHEEAVDPRVKPGDDENGLIEPRAVSELKESGKGIPPGAEM